MDINGISLEPTADPHITSHVNELNSYTGNDLGQNYLSDKPQARGLLGADSSFDKSLGYGDDGTMKAIQSKYAQKYNLGERQLDLNTMRQADADHLLALNSAAGLANQEVLQNQQKALLRYEIEQANKRAKGQILGQVLGITGGIVGGVAGAYSGTGPAGVAVGASAGYNLGSGAGQTMAGG